ncbi:MAG TPA: SOS response-associated peptidase [Rhizomicrobium sp.]|nr:SOS response-associated peptidase [Rhizomicrobium sp.]
MCGKFTQMMAWSKLVELSDLIKSIDTGATEMATPMRVASVIRLDKDGKRVAARQRWGLVPPGARDPSIGTQFIHARAETIDQRPTYRDAFLHRRGLLVVKTFNEGKEITPTKTEQHVITPRDGKPIAIGVIWERWGEPHAGALETFAMVTVPANKLIGTITDRMPAVIPYEDWSKWLGEEFANVEELKALLKPFEGDWDMEAAPRAKRPPPRKPDAQPDLF